MDLTIDPQEGNTMTATASRTGRLFHRISAIWSELDYAQRRLIENQTDFGQAASERGAGGRARDHATVR
jgi:hypothetical protein